VLTLTVCLLAHAQAHRIVILGPHGRHVSSSRLLTFSHRQIEHVLDGNASECRETTPDRAHKGSIHSDRLTVHSSWRFDILWRTRPAPRAPDKIEHELKCALLVSAPSSCGTRRNPALQGKAVRVVA